ncbi:zinc finger protein 800 [Danaus plexippus plexippus]|uniref:Zinc finger protein 800 n=2 Tax=Danaus plexippus plexippus TaxID=278856 RepID=A0A212EJN6_DANPL|nr:zinc finger protein 800 [Danaus plexippus plexippus]
MAGNKINTKKKEEKGKSNRIAGQSIEETEDLDFSLLRKPIHTSVTGFAQARKVFDLATEELKGLLSNECDLLYECKVCRNIFRSLANFISHKRVYCKEKFNPSEHGHFIKNTSSLNEILKIRKLEESYQEILRKENDSNEMDTEETEERIPLTKDLTDIIERISKTKGVQKKQLKEQNLVFQKIPKSNVAVFQNIESDVNKTDTMKAEVSELDKMLSQENAVLQSDGTFKVQTNDVQMNTENVIQISDDEDNEGAPYSVKHGVLKCEICDLQFSTQKTLKFHMKYKHLESRLVYPCPDCLDIFSTSWSVYRHLFKVHRKTAAQIRRLRESIQAKAFKMNNPPAFYEKRKSVLKNFPAQKITEEERIYQENQSWELEVEGEGRRCGGCGRSFERRAALAAHAHTCARRHTRRIQIQIRKDYHKEQSAPYLVMNRNNENKPSEEKSEKPPEKEIKEKEPKPLEEAVMSTVDVKQQETEDYRDDDTQDVPAGNTLQYYTNTLINKLPFAQQAEKSNLNAFKKRLQSDVEIDQLLCKKCNSKFEQIGELLEHVAGHYKWLRYACKLCNFKHFNFDKLPEHVKVVHKLKGDTDFYYSTVKAIDGSEASELSSPVEELTESNETSPDSRRPSRCSSDSSRLSDDSSSSSTRVETGSRKRKARLVKNIGKKKKDTVVIDDNEESKEVMHKGVLLGENDSSSNSKIFEENSSDLDEVDEKIAKRENMTSVACRRPVRKKTKRKNEDFEYDLSNLLKMEAQGYRDSQVTPKTAPSKKKVQQDVNPQYELINKECCGALVTMSRSSVEKAQAHMKTATFAVFNTSKEPRVSNIFVRPLVPKINRVDKISPKKAENEETKEISHPSPTKIIDASTLSNLCKELVITKVVNKKCEEKEANVSANETPKETEPIPQVDNKTVSDDSKEKKEEKNKVSEIEAKSDESASSEQTKTNVNVPTILPIKFRRQSLEVIQNPLIKKNITDFTKAGMKTKILVIKPINRSTDGTKTLKFQTIKLKDPNKTTTKNDEMKTEQVVVVKVPKVDCSISRSIPASDAPVALDEKCDENENEKVKTNAANPSNPTGENSVEEPKKDIKIENDITDLVEDKPESKLIECIELEEAVMQSG